MRIATTILIALVAVFLGALLIPIDPEEQRPGTRLSGALATNQQPNWDELITPRMKILVQTQTPWLIPHSVTTISVAAGGELYVPCARCSTKRWPKNVARDPRVRLKIHGELYDRVAVRVEDEALMRRSLGIPASEPLADVWLFRMDPA